MNLTKKPAAGKKIQKCNSYSVLMSAAGKKIQKCNSYSVLMSERHNFSLMLYTPYGLYLTRSLSQAKKIEI